MPTDEQARALIEKAHEASNRGDLDAMLAQFTADMQFWCNAGNPSGGSIEFTDKHAFRRSLEAMLRTTISRSKIVSFRFDDEIAHVRVRIHIKSLIVGAELEATYRQLVRYKGLLISRIEEYHDAARLNAFWKLHAEGAEAKLAVWDVDPSPGERNEPPAPPLPPPAKPS